MTQNKTSIKIYDWLFSILIPISVGGITLSILQIFKDDPLLTLVFMIPILFGMIGYVWVTFTIYNMATASLRTSGKVSE